MQKLYMLFILKGGEILKKKLSLKICTLIIGFILPINARAMYLQPCGEAIGVKMYTKGLIVIEVCSVRDTDGHQKYTKGILKGDIILSADGQEISSNEQFKNIISKKPKNIILEIQRKNEILQIVVEPILSDIGPTLGLWLRDSTAGIGTLTYFNPETKEFGALGHGICDSDTSALMPLQRGSIIECDITNVIKSSKGIVGELECEFSNNTIGKISNNNYSGLYGFGNIDAKKAIQTASPSEIVKGKASILCEINSEGTKEFQIEIKKINPNDKKGHNMVVEITDKRLLEITGGIVQGMSGSPIVQNGKLIGAITHVFVNDPTRGYGIFIENMLSEAEIIK